MSFDIAVTSNLSRDFGGMILFPSYLFIGNEAEIRIIHFKTGVGSAVAQW